METTADRVRKLIGELGMPQSAFAERVGLEPTKLSKSLNGVRRFSSLDLAMIGEFGHVTVDWLLTGEEVASATAARASVGSSTAQALALAQDYSTMRSDLASLGYEQHWRLPEPVALSGTWIGQGRALAAAASEMIERAGLSATDNLPEVVEAVFGIDVAVQELGDGFDGLAVATSTARLILVDATPISARQRFTIAHELGHLLASDDQHLHEDPDIFSASSRRGESEVRANAFASALLMPEALMKERLAEGNVVVPTLCALAGELRVSPSALAIRLEGLALIDQEMGERLRGVTAKEAARIAGRSAGFAQASAASMTPRPPASLLSDAFSAFENGDVTLRLYARLLGVETSVLRQQLEHIEDACC